MATDVLLEPEDADHIGGSWTLYNASAWTGSTWGKLRGALYANASATGTYIGLAFSEEKTTQCITCKWRWLDAATLNSQFFGFLSGTTPIIRVGFSTSSGSDYLKLDKWNPSGSTWTNLATSAAVVNNAFRLDMMIEDHGASARVRVWIRYWSYTNGQLNYSSPHQLLIDYSGDTSVSGHVIDGTFMAPMELSVGEMGPLIASDEATHRFEAFPVSIDGAGDVNTMASGTYADIDEVNADTTDYVESDTADQKILCTATNLPSSVSAVIAVKVSALASAGSSGPTDALLGIKSGGTENWDDTTHALGAGWEYIHRLMQTNPVTTNPWTVSEVNAIQYGVKSA